MDSKQSDLEKFWNSTQAEGGVPKLKTGISGFDELLEGGLPARRATLISAGPGSGKTVLLSEFLYRGATRYGEPGIFLTFEERPEEIRRNLNGFGWKLDELEAKGLISFIDAAPIDGEMVLGDSNWLDPMIARISHKATQMGAKRLSIDNLGAMFLRYAGGMPMSQQRELLFRFADRIKGLGLTALISSEKRESLASLGQYGVEEYVSDGLIELHISPKSAGDERRMVVRKLRGCTYRSGMVSYEISANGLEVFPKIPVDTRVGETNFEVRQSLGVNAINRAMGGGIPEGHVMLVAGNTGTGKTTLALHYILQGLKEGQSCVWVALEEPVRQVLKTAKAHGWDMQPYVDSGQLTFVTTSLLAMIEDKLLYRILDAVRKSGAHRVVVDSISSLESGSMSKESVREFMMQLAGFAKTKGITVLMNYLSGETFGAGKGQLLGSLMTNSMRMSSIVDGIILLRYVERDQSVLKLLNILKLRGSAHTKDILQYEIGSDGFTLGERFGTTL